MQRETRQFLSALIAIFILGGAVTAQDDDVAKQKKSEYQAACLLYTSPSPRDLSTSRMPSSA